MYFGLLPRVAYAVPEKENTEIELSEWKNKKWHYLTLLFGTFPQVAGTSSFV